MKNLVLKLSSSKTNPHSICQEDAVISKRDTVRLCIKIALSENTRG